MYRCTGLPAVRRVTPLLGAGARLPPPHGTAAGDVLRSDAAPAGERAGGRKTGEGCVGAETAAELTFINKM